MTERYEKLGTSVRLESTRSGRSVITLREGGYAEVGASGLSCGPLAPDPDMAPPASSVTAAIDETVTKMARGLAEIERLTLVEGRASHLLAEGSKKRRWSDTSGRLFVTCVRQPCGRKAALSLGADTLGAIDPSPVGEICQALALPESLAPAHAPALTLEPWVAASFVRALADTGVLPPSSLRLTQSPPPGVHEGRGRAPRRRAVKTSPTSWPDTFRPSYRFAPVAIPLHVDLAGARESDATSPFTAVALASSWVARAGALHARVWIVDRDSGRVSFSRLIIDPAAMSRRNVHSQGVAVWFPDGAGAWGRRITLSRPVALVRSA